jgi:hypothetical protein
VNSTAAFLATIWALGSPVGPRLDADLLAGPYSKSTMAAWRLPNSAVLFQQAVWLVVRFLYPTFVHFFMLCDFGGADVVFTFANILLYLLFQQAV